MQSPQTNRTGRGSSKRRTTDPAVLAIAEALRVHDAVDISGLSRTSLYNLMDSGKLPSRMIAGRRLILRADLVALLLGGAS
jgi:Helix-turn-helix domain